MYGSESTVVQYYDASYVQAGYFIHSAVSPNRAMAWDGTYFYTGSFAADIYQVTWDGVSGSSASSTLWSSAVANGGTYGAHGLQGHRRRVRLFCFIPEGNRRTPGCAGFHVQPFAGSLGTATRGP